MPAYSIGKQKKQPSFIRKEQTPGVGQYSSENWKQNSRIKKSGSASMTRAGRFFVTADGSGSKVGPGAYNPEKPTSRIQASLKGRHKSNNLLETPGPSAYNTIVKFPQKQYSFTKNTRKFDIKEGPAPDSYSLKNSRTQTGPIFGRQQRLKTLDSEIKPGPGDYIKEESSFSAEKKKDKYTFQRQKKFITEEMVENGKKKIPGPGAYDIVKFKKRFRGGKFTQATREKTDQSEFMPGPLSYNPTYANLKHNPEPTIGKSVRMRNKTEEAPGPGAYDIPESKLWKKNNGSTKFTQGNRTMMDFRQTPGPGTYEAKPQNSVGYSITARNFYQKKQCVPGPQDYQPNFKPVSNNNASTKFGNDEKFRKLKMQSPGPGHYNKEEKKFCKTYYFNKSTRRDKLNETVGPGSYKLKPFIGQYDGMNKDDKNILFV